MTVTPSQRHPLLKLRKQLMRSIYRTTSPGVRQALHVQLHQVSGLLSMPCPSLTAITPTH